VTDATAGGLLDEQRILDGLPVALRAQLRSLTLLRLVDSTNRFLLEDESAGADGIHVCLAESQTAGRGRRGRSWVSPFGANLYLSVLRAYALAPESLQGLSLAVGIATAGALQSLGVRGLALKWPNDVLLDGKKVGGILLEVSGTGAGSRVVAGIGVNVAMPADAGASIDQAWTDLAAHGVHPDRNRLAAQVLGEVITAGELFADAGFEAFRGAWQGLDAVRDREVALQDGENILHGIARGVDASGALLLEVDGRLERIVSGDISLRVTS
jgi:BirA family biotin operon repressor/biotin-[acetyl-CoA-carboxylase] ligase